MPNQCVHCSEIYDDGNEAVLKGCSKCGGRFFFYITQEKLKKINEGKSEDLKIDLTPSEKKQVESDVRDIVGVEESDTPIVLDIESVKILKPGKYLLDLHNLFNKNRPLVYKLEDGKYIIDLSSQMGLGKDI